MSTLPTSINVSNKDILLQTYKQLEQLSRKNLSNKVRDLQDHLGAERLPPVTGRGPDLQIDWILRVQCALCTTLGLELTPAHFGAPDGANEDGYFGRPLCESQQIERPSEVLQKSAPAPVRAPEQENAQLNVSTAQAYEAACGVAQMARQRNTGSNIFG